MPDQLKVLVVDDNEEFCRNMTDILELRDYAVETAGDGFRALELVEADGFDLVLMDVRMPGMDGVATFRRLKEVSPGTPVIMVTAFAVEELLRDALREGAYGALKKPLDFDELFDIMARATAGGGAMILVVDDDRDLCANMKDVLADKGYRVIIAFDGEAAVRLARENSFEFVLLDLKLPSLNGLETYLAIHDIRPDVVTIIVSGYLGELRQMARQAQDRNVYTCLEKPVDIDGLVSLLEQIRRQKESGTFRKPD